MGDSETTKTPDLTKETVAGLLKKLYGFTDVTISPLNGYYDKNYRVQVNKSYNEKELWPHGYVLKVINSLDSKNINYIDAQTKLTLYLGENGINSPQPVKNLTGKYYSLEDLQQDDAKTSKHLVRLLNFQPGQLLAHIPCTNEILYEIGKLVANFGKTVKGFHHSAYDSEKPLWSLQSVPQIRNIINIEEDEQKRALVMSVLDRLLHGDIHEQNVLMSKSNNENWDICAIFDFGDTHRSCLLFDLAVNMAHMTLLTSDPISAGGHILAGYNTVRILPEKELQLLKASITFGLLPVCVCARLCMLVMMGAYTFKKDPQNEYLLCWTKMGGWEVLDLLWHTPQDELICKWKNVTSSYLI
ncbi:hypothetical protein C0J52_21401 [Blattella germanica]|nr:hypothetical protein C0J52_21401 [Blattella germanica]